MTDINLLRWHLPRQENSKNLKCWISVASILIIIFSILHWMLSNTQQKYQREKNELKANLQLSHPSQSFFNMDKVNQLQLSQKKLWQMLNLFTCLQENRIQITKIYSEKNGIVMDGFTESALTLSQSLTFCLPERPLQKIMIRHKYTSGLLQFSCLL